MALGGCDDDDDPPHPDPQAAIDTCREGLEQLQEVPLSERSASLGRACADLYAEPACRDAMRDSGELPPDRRAATLAQTCRDVYCPKLSEPRPALCDLDFDEARASELPAMWSELSHAALVHALGRDRAEQVRGIFSAAVVAAAPEPEREEQPSIEQQPSASLQVAVQRDDDGAYHLHVTHPDGSTTTREIADLDAQAVAGAVPSAGELGDDASAIVAADRTLPYDAVVTVMDGLRVAGYTNRTTRMLRRRSERAALAHGLGASAILERGTTRGVGLAASALRVVTEAARHRVRFPVALSVPPIAIPGEVSPRALDRRAALDVAVSVGAGADHRELRVDNRSRGCAATGEIQ